MYCIVQSRYHLKGGVGKRCLGTVMSEEVLGRTSGNKESFDPLTSSVVLLPLGQFPAAGFQKRIPDSLLLLAAFSPSPSTHSFD